MEKKSQNLEDQKFEINLLMKVCNFCYNYVLTYFFLFQSIFRKFLNLQVTLFPNMWFQSNVD